MENGEKDKKVDETMVIAMVNYDGEKMGCLVLPQREPYLSASSALCSHVGRRAFRACKLGTDSNPEDLALAALCFGNLVLANLLYGPASSLMHTIVRVAVHQSIRFNMAAILMLCDMGEVTKEMQSEIYDWCHDLSDDEGPLN